MNPSSLTLWTRNQRVATLDYEALTDQWSLSYHDDWIASPTAFALSPALPLRTPIDGYAAGAVKRFIENLLPEGRTLDIIAATCRVSKANIYALISELGAETTGAFCFWRTDETPPATQKWLGKFGQSG